MTTEKRFSPKTSELATADNSAITVKAVSPAPIATDLSNQWESFTARPAVATTGKALSTAKDGLVLVWGHEKEFKTGQNFARFCFDASKSIALPLLNLGWLAANHGYQFARKPETKAAIVARYQSVKAYLSPKHDYETEADRNSAIEL